KRRPAWKANYLAVDQGHSRQLTRARRDHSGTGRNSNRDRAVPDGKAQSSRSSDPARGERAQRRDCVAAEAQGDAHVGRGESWRRHQVQRVHRGWRAIVEAQGLAVPLGPLSRLAQVEEPGMRSGEAGGRGGLGVMSESVRLSGSSPSARTASPANAKLLQMHFRKVTTPRGEPKWLNRTT